MGSYKWIPAEGGAIPRGAVKAGEDLDGSDLYAGRAYHEGELLPAKVSQYLSGAMVAHGGEEHFKDRYEVLCVSSFSWQKEKHGKVPPTAVEVGITAERERLYMGRVKHEGSLVPGKIHPSNEVLYISFGGKEIAFDEYEVLVEN